MLAALVLALTIAEYRPRLVARDLPRACTLAAANAMGTEAWLASSHPRRETALLLLTRDAAWAPVCAKDPAAGERLRNEIFSMNDPDARDAQALAHRLVLILQEGQ
jgi:hypothetical protein